MRDLYACINGDPDTDLNGRSGQPQHGVDVYGVEQHKSRRLVGVQCRGRETYPEQRPLTAKELQEEVRKALRFEPKLEKFVLVTTGKNDVRVKNEAAAITERHKRRGLFEVQVHGWDWIEGKLRAYPELAVTYGLVASVSSADIYHPPNSAIAEQIGARFRRALALMNVGRKADDRFTVQGLAHSLGMVDWRLLEDLARGHAKADTGQLSATANQLGVSPTWLLEGKGEPFAPDANDYGDAEEQYRLIEALKPERIVFVRETSEPFRSIVVAQVSEFRWTVFEWDHPTSSHVGGTGRRQLFEYCCLMRRLYRELDFNGTTRCYGQHLEATQFRQLLEGKSHPGSLLRYMHNDHWWDDFAELDGDRVEGNTGQAEELREAIHITRGVLADFQRRAAKPGYARDMLLAAGVPLKDGTNQRYALEAGLYRPQAK
jgi:hypothetical protein